MDDREQEEIQFFGFLGILKESYHIVSYWRYYFTSPLILPLSFVYLVQIQISRLLFFNIISDKDTLDRTRSYDIISDVLSSEWTATILFKVGYIVFFLILSRTSATVYTIACIYTIKDITFKKVMSVVPKVWKRLTLTFILNFIIIFAYHIVAVLVLIHGAVALSPVPFIAIPLLIIFSIAHVVGLLYINMIWQLGTVVSVLDDSYGLNAMAKSRDLIKGKMGVYAAVFFLLGLYSVVIELIFKIFTVIAYEKGQDQKIAFPT